MAERLSEYEFPGVVRKYPWVEWLDGSPWRLRQGTDFECKPHSFRTMAADVARARGLGLRTTRENETTVVIQSFEKETLGPDVS